MTTALILPQKKLDEFQQGKPPPDLTLNLFNSIRIQFKERILGGQAHF